MLCYLSSKLLEYQRVHQFHFDSSTSLSAHLAAFLWLSKLCLNGENSLSLSLFLPELSYLPVIHQQFFSSFHFFLTALFVIRFHFFVFVSCKFPCQLGYFIASAQGDTVGRRLLLLPACSFWVPVQVCFLLLLLPVAAVVACPGCIYGSCSVCNCSPHTI